MHPADFFGDQSPFQVIVAVVAFGTAIYTFYRSFLQRPKLQAHVGDKMELVLPVAGGVRTFHLWITVVNSAERVGTLQRLEAEVQDPTGKSCRFEWKLFFESAPGGTGQLPKSLSHPVSVAGRMSELVCTEFESVGHGQPQWPAGVHTVRLNGWVNKKNLKEEGNLEATFHIDVTGEKARQLATDRPSTPTLVSVPIVEWSRGNSGERDS